MYIGNIIALFPKYLLQVNEDVVGQLCKANQRPLVWSYVNRATFTV